MTTEMPPAVLPGRLSRSWLVPDKRTRRAAQPSAHQLRFPLHALGRIEIPSWDAGNCQLCDASVPLRKPGTS